MRVDNYKRCTWEQRLGPRFHWIIATWQDPGTPQDWYAKTKNQIPYPPQGWYFPISGSQIPCDPTTEITSEAIRKIRRILETSFEEILARSVDAQEQADQQIQAQSDDRIDSDWPAFNCEAVVPGCNLEENKT